MATVRMVPQCECGYIFSYLKISKVPKLEETGFRKSTLFPMWDYNPVRCPQCGQSIDNVQITVPQNDAFIYEYVKEV